MTDKLIYNLQMFGENTPVDPTADNTHDTPNFGELLEPGLRAIFFQTYDEIPEQFAQIYNVDTSTKAKETDWGMGAFGDWEARQSNYDTVAYKTLSPGLERVYVHEAFTQGFMVTREMYDDDQYRQFEKMPAAMARSGRAKLETDTMLPLINGFDKATAPIYDGEALFSDKHPLLEMDYVENEDAPYGDNLATGALTADNLKAALVKMRQTVDEVGNLIQLKATKLIVPPVLEDTAKRLIMSTQLPGTDFNDTNVYLSGAGIQIVVLDYLGASAGGSDTAWYLQDGNRHQLNFFWRVRPEFKWNEDFDTFVAKYRGYMRYSYGVSDWRGLVGSTGLVDSTGQ